MASKLKSFLACLRYRDAFIFQAPTLIGLTLFFPNVSPANGLRALLVSVGSFLLMAYIFSFNDWADIRMDCQNAQTRRSTFLDKGITEREMLALSISLAGLGVLILSLVSRMHILVAFIIILLGLAYSLPVQGIQGKGLPVFSSGLHFVNTLLACLLGSLAFSPIDARALGVGSYLGLLITAGHLIQEVEDYIEDRLANVGTHAVRFGPKPMFIFACGLFGFSFLFLFGLAQAGLIPVEMKYTLLLYPIFLVAAIRAYRAGLNPENVWRLREQYRLLFAIVALSLLVSALVNKGVSV